MRDFSFKEIGVIYSCFPDKFGTPRQPSLVPQAKAVLKIHKEWQPESSLLGLEKFSHLWVLFVFHLNTNKAYHAKVKPPRLDGDSMGVFATRSPHRPNPIGQSLVKIEKIEGDKIYLSGIDLVDGTPVIDIKPYLPHIEAKVEANAGWVSDVEIPILQIEWSDQAKEDFRDWTSLREQKGKTSEDALMSKKSFQLDCPHQDLKTLIEAVIAQDPRPVIYKGFEGQESPYRQNHAVRIFDGDIHFVFRESHRVEIQKIVIV